MVTSKVNIEGRRPKAKPFSSGQINGFKKPFVTQHLIENKNTEGHPSSNIYSNHVHTLFTRMYLWGSHQSLPSKIKALPNDYFIFNIRNQANKQSPTN